MIIKNVFLSLSLALALFSMQPVTYQHLEEFLISAGQKEKVTLSQDGQGEEFYLLTESRTSIHLPKSG